ncbi:MAG: M10 family metallopeptidase C-terminal domain-containing protein [Rickettsiales bacterium]|nr:M10 family metallopeptidase C-terminal domain-containing protein [Rickettsiales bacterium]
MEHKKISNNGSGIGPLVVLGGAAAAGAYALSQSGFTGPGTGGGGGSSGGNPYSHQTVDDLDSGARWTPNTLSRYGGRVENGKTVITVNMDEYNSQERAAAQDWLDHFEDVANVEFEVVSGERANINFMHVEDYQGTPPPGAYAFANLPGSGGSNVYMPSNTNYAPGSYGYQVIGHELGHAMGLSHPEGIGAASGFDTTTTIMSYNNDGIGTTLQPLDIATVQHMYGANPNYNRGDNTYYLDGNITKETIWDTGGNDTIDTSRFNGNAVIDLRDQLGAESRAGYSRLWIAEGSRIENARSGSGNDIIGGNEYNNTIRSGAGNDQIRGFQGNDQLYGGTGNDKFYFGEDFGRDTVHDFNKGDTFAFDRNVFSSREDVIANTEYRNGNAIISDGNGNSVTIRGVSPGSLTTDDVEIRTISPNVDHSTQSNASAPDNPMAGQNQQNAEDHYFACGCLACCAARSEGTQNNEESMQQSNTDVNPLVVASGVLSAGVISMGVAGFNHRYAKKNFQETVDKRLQEEYQKQRDAGEAPSATKAYEQSKLGKVKDDYIKQSSRTWGITGFMTGAGLASAAVAAAGVLTGGLVPLALAGIGLAAGLVSGFISYGVASKALKNRAEGYVARSAVNPENQKGVNQESLQKDSEELAADKERMLKMTDKLLGKEQQALGTDHNSRVANNDKMDWLNQKGDKSVGYARQ